jgi:hypothetical protein
MRGGLGGSGIVAIKFMALSGTKGIAGSTAITSTGSGTTLDTPSLTLDATTEAATPTLDMNFTTAMTSFPKNIWRYNISTHDALGVEFDRTASRKKRVKKTINADKFSMEMTANNAVSSSSTALPVTVSGGKFSISGSETPVLTLVRGKTYVFDQTDSTNGTHPLLLSTTSNGTHGGGSQYTSGWSIIVAPSGGNQGKRQLIVPANAPDTLYYYCQNHSGMGGTINVITHNLVTFGDFTLYANATVSGEHTIATNFDGTTSNVYVDGDLITSASTSVTAGAKLLTLGEYYSGRIKDFKFWNLAKSFLQQAYATGGTITYITGYTVHTFTSSGNFVPEKSLDVEYLVIAGGGGGGGHNAGGGGAGGLLTNLGGTKMSITATSYAVVVGAGGTGGTNQQGSNGSASSFNSIAPTGGGGGGSQTSPYNAQNGGSGGGAGVNGTTPGTGISGQGYGGGTGHGNPYYHFGGGGGSGAVGDNYTSSTAGNGGVGTQVNIDGNNYYWAGGGGGSAYTSGTAGDGGLGGGGGGGFRDTGTRGSGGGSALNSGADGENVSDGYGGAGGTNTGSGGGASHGGLRTGGAGGSGIVIIRYAS